MQPYRWSCLACAQPNAREANACAACGCPAQASYAQIRAARESAGIVKPCEGPNAGELLGLIMQPFGREQQEATATRTLAEVGLVGALWLALKALAC